MASRVSSVRVFCQEHFRCPLKITKYSARCLPARPHGQDPFVSLVFLRFGSKIYKIWHFTVLSTIIVDLNVSWHKKLTFHSFKKFSKFESWNVLDVIGGGGKCNKLCYSASRKLRLGNVFSGVYLSAILSTFVGSLMWLIPMMHWTSSYRDSTPPGHDLPAQVFPALLPPR